MADEDQAQPMPWPKHPDGRNKKMGEMTADERRAQWRQSAQRVAGEFAATRH